MDGIVDSTNVEFEQTPGDSEGQGSLAYCSPWGHKESEMTELMNHNNQGCQCGDGMALETRRVIRWGGTSSLQGRPLGEAERLSLRSSAAPRAIQGLEKKDGACHLLSLRQETQPVMSPGAPWKAGPCFSSLPHYE